MFSRMSGRIVKQVFDFGGREFALKGNLGGVHQFNYATAAGPAAQPVPNRVEKTINQVMLLGRVGADPQKRGTQEHPVVVFSLATHANYQYGTGDLLQKTDWHRVCVFKPFLRDTVYKYMNKGQRVLVQGRITYGEVKSEDGTSHMTTSIIADDVTFFFQKFSRHIII